jgi:hypothetical protein
MCVHHHHTRLGPSSASLEEWGDEALSKIEEFVRGRKREMEVATMKVTFAADLSAVRHYPEGTDQDDIDRDFANWQRSLLGASVAEGIKFEDITVKSSGVGIDRTKEGN